MIQRMFLQPPVAGREPTVDKPEPVCQPIGDQIDIPAEARVPRLASAQPRPPPRGRNANSARLTTSLIEIVLTDAYNRTR
jgi:hypothetical protein